MTPNKTCYRLICLSATLVTGVSSHCHHGLDLSGTGHYPSNVHQFPDGVGLDITHHFGFSGGGRFEVQFTVNNTMKMNVWSVLHSRSTLNAMVLTISS